MKELPVGLTHRARITVDENLTVPRVAAAFHGFADMPPVFATAFMVGFVEATCIEALKPYLAENERTVGTHVDMSHRAATPVGMTVTAEVELVAVERRRLRFRVECRDAVEVIGAGHHERVVIESGKFIAHTRSKAARASA
jgi:fluoroacetyl-CoA thioesterase